MTTNPMKPLYLLLSFSLLVPGLVKGQTVPSTKPLTTTPATSTINATSRPSVRPPSTRAAQSDATNLPGSTAITPNRQQELYDQYHGITKKPTPPPPVAVTTEPVREATPEPAPTVASVPEKIASSSENSGFRIGIRGGVTYPIYLEKVTGVDPAVGFVGGLVMQFGRGSVSFQPEINYSRISSKSTSSGSGSTNLSTDQVTVPLFLKIASGTFDGNRFFLNIGPYASYFSSYSQNGIKRDISSDVGRFTFGAAAGVGAMLKAGPGHITIEARGLYQLASKSGFSTDSRTILGEGTLGYVFPLGR